MTFQNAKVTPGAGEAPEDSGTFNKINGIIGVTGSSHPCGLFHPGAKSKSSKLLII